MNAYPYHPPVLNELVLLQGVAHRVWFANPQQPRAGAWLIKPDGLMFWAAASFIAAQPRAPEGVEAFPPADPVRF